MTDKQLIAKASTNRYVNNLLIQRIGGFISKNPEIILSRDNFNLSIKRYLLFFQRIWLEMTLPNHKMVAFVLNNHPQLREKLDDINQVALNIRDGVFWVDCYG
jgi:hypothetical protein